MAMVVNAVSPAANGGQLSDLLTGAGDDVEGYVPLSSIIILEQVRKTYEGIEALANDQAANGEIYSVQIRVCTKPMLAEHLLLVNRLWGTSYCVADFRPIPGTRGRLYAVLISGHRRTKCKHHLWEYGCDVCVEAYGQEEPGVCFARHFDYGFEMVKVRLYYEITAIKAIGLQCRENIRGSVPPHEQADAYERLFSLMLVEESDLTLAEFARRVGHVLPETISRARRFCRLPEVIRQDVADCRIGYGVALELGRLVEALDLDEATMMSERTTIIDQGLGLRVYRRHARDLITARESGATSFFDLGAETAGNNTVRRQVFEAKTVAALHALFRYFERATPLLESGEMGPDGTWPDTSAVRLFVRGIEIQQKLLPFLRERLSKLEAEGAEAILAEADQLLQQIGSLDDSDALLPASS